jgi:hypothetical protein
MAYNSTEHIKRAKLAYILPIGNPNSNSCTNRYSIYLDCGEGLEVLWGEFEYVNDVFKKGNMLDYQVHTDMKQYPAFHFRLNGGGYSKTHSLACMLRDINPSIRVSTIGGYQPSPVSM